MYKSFLKIIILVSTCFAEASDNFEKVAGPIAERIMPFVENYRAGNTKVRPVIAIAGCAGVGKSYFAEQLQDHFSKMGIPAKVLHFDDFIDPEPFEGALEKVHPRFDYLRAHAVLRKIWEGEEIIEKPAWNTREPGANSYKITEDYDVRGAELLIFEGAYILCDENTFNFVALSNVRIVLDAANNTILRWDYERGRWRNRNIKSFEDYAKNKIRVLSHFRKILDPLTEKYADLIIKKDSKHNYFIGRRLT